MIIAKLEHNKKASALKYQANYECLQARHSCKAQGASPGLIIGTYLLSPFRGGTPLSQTNARAESTAPHRSSYYLLFVFTQGFISGFALIAPWALQECRAYGTHNVPGF